ncbi:putative porin [Parahaliea mediterranea]|uniref:putative porin n=1 Tax=Parahaliea mediterranea TaxID=651086 RepID=UPI000E2E8567|nr:putative porin [Parahaliea mediterranea]
MFKKIAIISSLSLLVAGGANADYQWELGGNYATGEIDSDAQDADQDIFGFQGRYYIAPVDTSKGPLAEAAFLDRASHIELNYENGEIDLDGLGDVDSEAYSLGGRWVHKESGWLADFEYRVDEIDDQDIDTYSVGIGRYLGQNTTLTASYGHVEQDDVDFLEADIWGLDVEHLMSFDNGTSLKMAAGYGYVDTDEGDSGDQYRLEGTYYPTEKLGIGAAYERLDVEQEVDNWKVYADWFVNDQVALTVSYGESDFDTWGLDAQEFLLGVRVRF